MSLEQIFVLVLLAVVLVGFIKEVYPPEVIAIAASAVLLATGIVDTGAAAFMVENAVQAAGTAGPLAVLAAVYVLTSVLTAMVSNNAAAVMLAPLVISLATELGHDPRPFIIGVMFAASASFATPIGYQTNTFVYSAGGYRFRDFVVVGLPLNILFAVVAVPIVPWFFPF